MLQKIRTLFYKIVLALLLSHMPENRDAIALNSVKKKIEKKGEKKEEKSKHSRVDYLKSWVKFAILLRHPGLWNITVSLNVCS